MTTSPIEWSITILNSGSDVLFVSGQATTTLSTECVRCLEPAEYEVEGEIEGYVALSTSAKLPKDVGEDELTPYEDDHSIDVAPLIEAAITLELPLQPLCSDDCPGIEYDHGQVSESSETHPFEVLKNYKF